MLKLLFTWVCKHLCMLTVVRKCVVCVNVSSSIHEGSPSMFLLCMSGYGSLWLAVGVCSGWELGSVSGD